MIKRFFGLALFLAVLGTVGPTSLLRPELVEATYTPTIIKSIQRGTITISNAGTSGTATITSVNTALSIVKYNGSQGNDTNNITADFGRLVLTNATTVTLNRGNGVSGAMVTAYEVIEYNPIFIKSIQVGTIAMTDGGATSNTATITSVNTARTLLFHEGQNVTSSTSGNSVTALITMVELTNATTVTATRQAAAGIGMIMGFTALEFK